MQRSSDTSHKKDPVIIVRGSMLVIFVLLGFIPSNPVQSQPVGGGRENRLQAGFGLVPGVGIQGAYVRPRGVYTAEAALYGDIAPQFLGGEGSLQLSLGIGGAIRPLGFVRLIGNADYPYDIDLGLRFGPALFFAFNETRATKNQRFSLFLEPYIRFTSHLGNGRTFFVEAGIQRPLFRAGFWFYL